jgi:hypothetical protein
MLKIQRFLSVFQKRRRSKIIVLYLPSFHAFGSGVYAPFTSSPYAMEKVKDV